METAPHTPAPIEKTGLNYETIVDEAVKTAKNRQGDAVQLATAVSERKKIAKEYLKKGDIDLEVTKWNGEMQRFAGLLRQLRAGDLQKLAEALVDMRNNALLNLDLAEEVKEEAEEKKG